MKTKSLAKWLKGAAYVAIGGALLYSAVAILTIEDISLDAPLKKNVKFEILAIESDGRQSIAFTGELRAGMTRLPSDVLGIFPRQRVHNDAKTKYHFVTQDPVFLPHEAGMHINLDVSPMAEQNSPYGRLGNI